MKSLCFVALTLIAAVANAAPAQIVVKTSTYGVTAQPFTGNFGQTLAPFGGSYGTGDFFVADYGFTTTTSGSFTAAVVTFNLSDVLQLSDLSMSLLSGTPYSGSVPAQLSDADIADRAARTLASSTGSSTTQTIAATALQSGDYLLEIRGRITGSAGGSYGGVLNLANVAAVPEPNGAWLGLVGLAGVGLAAASRRRTRLTV